MQGACRILRVERFPAPVHHCGMARKTKKERPAHYLKEWRDYRGLTQEQLADKAKTAANVISHLETGDRRLSDKWLMRLAPHLNTTPGSILDYDPNEIDTTLQEIWANISQADRPQAARVFETFRKKAKG